MASSAQPGLDKNFTEGRFHDRLYIVTGGASGIGLATVERLCNDGAKVAILDVNKQGGKDVESRLQAEAYEVRFYSVDVSREEECERGVQEVVRDFGDVIHGLVNNAGIFETHEKGEDVTASDFDRILGVNLKGALYMVKSTLPYLKKGESSAIVNTCSILGKRAVPGSWGYNSSKGGLIALTRSMALDLCSYGIRVNGVCPGAIWTNMLAEKFGKRSEVEPKWSTYNMMKRSADPCEVASAITFLLSKDASFITGANLDVDGGTNAMCPPVGQ